MKKQYLIPEVEITFVVIEQSILDNSVEGLTTTTYDPWGDSETA